MQSLLYFVSYRIGKQTHFHHRSILFSCPRCRLLCSQTHIFFFFLLCMINALSPCHQTSLFLALMSKRGLQESLWATIHMTDEIITKYSLSFSLPRCDWSLWNGNECCFFVLVTRETRLSCERWLSDAGTPSNPPKKLEHGWREGARKRTKTTQRTKTDFDKREGEREADKRVFCALDRHCFGARRIRSADNVRWW